MDPGPGPALLPSEAASLEPISESGEDAAFRFINQFLKPWLMSLPPRTSERIIANPEPEDWVQNTHLRDNATYETCKQPWGPGGRNTANSLAVLLQAVHT